MHRTRYATATGLASHYSMKRVGKLLAFLVFIASNPAWPSPLVFKDTLLFETSNQSMWSQGGQAEWSAETFVGTRWGTYAGGSAVDKSLGIDVGAASVSAGFESSGELGIVPWAKASGGAINISLPVQAVVTLPDKVQTNTPFRVSTSFAIQPGYGITASAPSFAAGVDGLINMDNRIYGEAATFIGCGRWGLKSCEWSGGVDVDLHVGRFSLIGFDTTQTNPLQIFGLDLPFLPGVNNQLLIHSSTPYLYDSSKGEMLPPPPTAILGHLTLHTLQDESGGILAGDRLKLSTYQEVFEGMLSVTGVVEKVLFPATPGVLRHDQVIFANKIKDIHAGWTLLDIGTGPMFGMEQNFILDPNLSVRLEFDRAITRRYGEHEETYADGKVTFALGEEGDLLFRDGFANLIGMEYILNYPEFSNDTLATIDPALQIQSLCVDFTGLGNRCAFDETYQTEGLLAFNVYNDSWAMGGFNSVRFERAGLGPQEIPEPSTLLLLLPAGVFLGRIRSGRMAS